MTAIVGLTGGIASGKSSVAKILRGLGVSIVDADQVAREVVEPGTAGLSAIVEAFGSGVLGPDGALDRKALGALVFGDAEKRRVLESLTHPRIFARSMEKLGALAASGAVYGVYDAALLVENGSYKMMAAPRALQRERIVLRDHLTEAEADARIDAQLPLEEKIAVADHVIWNDADLATLSERTISVHTRLLERFRT